MKHLEYSIVIPSNRNFENIEPLLKCLKIQTSLPNEIIIVYDKLVSKSIFENYTRQCRQIFQEIETKLTIVSKFNFSKFTPGKGASFVRNFGIKMVKTEFILCVDDDNEFKKDFIEKLFLNIKNKTDGKPGVIPKVLVPTEIYRKSGKIRSTGYSGFNYFLGRPIANIVGKNKETLEKIDFSSSNCLFGYTKIFQENLFDEKVPFVYEDFIFTKKLSENLFLAKNVFTNHMMRDKSKIEDLYISSKSSVYQKGRNRIIFVKRYGKIIDKIIYFSFGIRIHTLYLILIIFFKGKNKFSLLKFLIKGTFDGIKS